MQADLDDYWAVGGGGAEFRRVVPGERSLLKLLLGNLNFKRLFSAVAEDLSDETRKSVDVPTLFILRYSGAAFILKGYTPNGDGVVC